MPRFENKKKFIEYKNSAIDPENIFGKKSDKLREFTPKKSNDWAVNGNLFGSNVKRTPSKRKNTNLTDGVLSSPTGSLNNKKRKGCSPASRNSANLPGSMRRTSDGESLLKRSTSLNYGYKIPSLVNDQNIKRENFPMTLLNQQNTVYHMWVTDDPVFKDYGNLKKSRKASEGNFRSRAEFSKSTAPAPEVVNELRLEKSNSDVT